MAGPKPTPDTVTVASQSVELLLTGKPDVKYKWGSGSIRPGLVIFTYRQEGIRAHLYGVWVREDGEVTDQPCDQAYRIGDTDEWPDWLADLAREPEPADRAPRRDQVAEALRAAAFECDGNCGLSEQDCYDAHPISFSAMSNGVTHVTGSVIAIADAVLAVLPEPADRAAVYAEVAERLAADAEQGEKEGFTRIYRRSAAKQVRDWADEAQQADPGTPRCGAWGGCPLPRGHNMGQADVPSNHQPETPARLAAYQTCGVCKSGYPTGGSCGGCAFNARMAAEARPVFELPGPEVVAYRNSDRPGVLLCREHGDGWWGLTPLTSDDLPDGGTCTYGDPADPDDVCGRDVLIPRPGKEA